MFDFVNILASSAATTAEEADVVTRIVKTFGVNTPLFTSQVISFFIVAFVLKKYAFGPVQQMLEQRRARISEGEEKLKRIEKQLADSEKRTQEAIDEANASAQRLINEAKESAASLSEKKAQEAINAAQQILAKAEEAAKAERKAMTIELKQEFGRLITSTTANVTGKLLTETDQKRINEEALAVVKG